MQGVPEIRVEDMLRAVNPSVSSSLHEPGRVNPYSVTPLWFKKGIDVKEVTFSMLDLGVGLVSGSWMMVWLLSFLSVCMRGSVLIYDVVFRIGSVSVRSEVVGPCRNEGRIRYFVAVKLPRTMHLCDDHYLWHLAPNRMVPLTDPLPQTPVL